jgi:hypothetical protein
LYPKIKESSGAVPVDHLIATSQLKPCIPRPPDLAHSASAYRRNEPVRSEIVVWPERQMLIQLSLAGSESGYILNHALSGH